MTRDLFARMRRLLVERTGHDYVSLTHAHLTELIDRCEAAEAFGAACVELRAAKSTFWEPGGQERGATAGKNCVPKEVTPDA